MGRGDEGGDKTRVDGTVVVVVKKVEMIKG